MTTPPTPAPDPTPAELDQAVIDAGRALAMAQIARPRDDTAITAAREQLAAAREARGYADA